MLCSIVDCEREVQAKGLCKVHYERLRRGAKVDVEINPKSPIRRICIVDGCTNLVKAMDWCQTHYKWWKRTGNPIPPATEKTTVCSVKGCDKKPIAHGFCGTHYARFTRNGNTDLLPARVHKQCSVSGCMRKMDSMSNYCPMHYRRFRMTGDPGPLEPNRRSNGQGSINKAGYVVHTKNGRRRMEHNLIMEEILGRPLDKCERVHHRNGIRNDNRHENLELWLVGHPPGQRVDDLIEFVCRLYPDKVTKTTRVSTDST